MNILSFVSLFVIILFALNFIGIFSKAPVSTTVISTTTIKPTTTVVPTTVVPTTTISPINIFNSIKKNVISYYEFAPGKIRINILNDSTKYRTKNNSTLIIIPGTSIWDSIIVYSLSDNLLSINWNRNVAPNLNIASTINTIIVDRQIFNVSLNTSDYSRTDYINLKFYVLSI